MNNPVTKDTLREKLAGREPQIRAIAEYLGCNADELWKEMRAILEWEYAEQAVSYQQAIDDAVRCLPEGRSHRRTGTQANVRVRNMDVGWNACRNKTLEALVAML